MIIDGVLYVSDSSHLERCPRGAFYPFRFPSFRRIEVDGVARWQAIVENLQSKAFMISIED